MDNKLKSLMCYLVETVLIAPFFFANVIKQCFRGGKHNFKKIDKSKINQKSSNKVRKSFFVARVLINL